jgi:hypothetical protein
MTKIATVLQPIMNALFTELGNIFMPILEGVEHWLEDSGNIEMITQGIKDTFAGIKEFVTPIFEMLGKLAMDLIPVILVVWEKIKPVVNSIKGFIMDIVGSIGTLLNKLATGNGEFTTMEKIVGAIGMAFIGWKATMMGINIYKKIMLGYERASETYAKGKLAIENLINNAYVKQAAQMIKNAAIAAKDFLKATGSAVMKVISSLSAIPVVGVALGIAAAAGVAAMAYKYMNDGVQGPVGGGKQGYSRTMFGPEGAISFNDKDTIIAGTNLGGSGKSSGGGGGDAVVAELQRVSSLLQAILSKEGAVMIDGNKVGTTLALSNYKQQ